MSVWVNRTTISTSDVPLCIAYTGSAQHYFMFFGLTDGTWRFQVRGGAPYGIALTTTSLSAGVWGHLCAIEHSTTSRDIYLNGGGKGSNTTAVTPSGLNKTSIGCMLENDAESYHHYGSVAEACLWNAALSVAEVTSLAAGAHPFTVRPGNLVSYWNLVRGLGDSVGGNTLTAGGTTVVAHPRVRYPSSALVIPAAAAAPPAGLSIPVAMHHYAQMRG